MATLSNNNNGSNKRVRRDAYKQLQLSDLPQGILPKVASYLSNTSCVSFAMSLTSDLFSHEPSAISTAIINASLEGWESVDFKDIQDICGFSLTDDYIRWVLLAIDGVDKIKSLKFTNCIGITGSGLEPLTGSTELKRIDLSLVGDYENPNITPEPPISAAVVVPILNSIIEREDNVFEHVQLPKKWRIEKSDILTQFLIRLDEVLTESEFYCSKPSRWPRVIFPGGACENVCQQYDLDGLDYYLVCWQQGRHYDDPFAQRFHDDKYGIVAFSCYQCMKKICGVCEWNGGAIDLCLSCEKMYCGECNRVEHCEGINCSGSDTGQVRSCEVCDTLKSW